MLYDCVNVDVVGRFNYSLYFLTLMGKRKSSKQITYLKRKTHKIVHNSYCLDRPKC